MLSGYIMGLVTSTFSDSSMLTVVFTYAEACQIEQYTIHRLLAEFI
jgi:hypothetical protein